MHGDSLTLSSILTQLRRHRLLFALATLMVFAAGVVIVERLPKRYTAVSELLIDQQKPSLIDAQQATQDLPIDTDVVDTQVLVLESRHLADRVALDLKLDRDPEFNPSLRAPGLMQKIKSLLGSHPAPLSPADQHTNVVDSLLGSVKVGRSALTYVIDVSATTSSPAKSAAIANAIANDYLTEQLDQKFEATQKADEWLNSHLAGLRNKVLNAEAAVANYKASHGLMGLTDAQGATITQQEISNLDTQIAAARADQAKAEATLSSAREEIADGRLGDALGDALSSQVIQDLRARRAQLSGQVAEMASKYGPKYPAMVEAQDELADIDAQINAELKRITAGLELQAQVAAGETYSLEQSLATAKQKLASAGAATVGLNELERDAEADTALYQSFLDKFKQTDVQQSLQQSDASILSAAVDPTSPSSPHRVLLILLDLIVAATIGGVAVAIAAAADDRVFTTRDIETIVQSEHIGSIPLLESLLTRAERRKAGNDAALYIVKDPLSVLAESFRKLRTSLLYAPDGRLVQTIAITSALPGEGKTTSCVSLGRVIAMGGVSAVVVDCDFHKHAIARFLPQEPKAGVMEVLSGKIPMSQALVPDPETSLQFLPAGKWGTSPQDLFSGPAIDALIADLKERFQIVLFDTSPLLPISAARALATKVDVNVLVAKWGKTDRQAAATAMRELTSVGATVAGVVLTQVDVKQQPESGYGAYNYYRAYRPEYRMGRIAKT